MATGEIHYDEALYARLFELESHNFWFRVRNRLIAWSLATYAANAPRKLLEIGCGTGMVLTHLERAFPDWHLAGTEVLAEGLAYARTRVTRAELFELDARNIPFSNAYGAIGAFDVLEHIAEDERVLGQMHQALVPGGLLLLTVPQHPWLWSPADDLAQHQRRYTARELAAKVRGAGFDIELLTSFVSILLPVMALSRLRQRANPAGYDLIAELSMPAGLNALFEAVLDFERRLIQRGSRFPAGGSLLLVARRNNQPSQQSQSTNPANEIDRDV